MPDRIDSEPDAHDSYRAKVEAIFRELAGERASRLGATSYATASAHAIAASYAPDMDSERAKDIGFHLTDWASDAAFFVALHLFPERFTPEEIQAGIGMFFVHAPYHIAEAAALAGEFVPASADCEPEEPEANEPKA